jgi:hypothetical protein
MPSFEDESLPLLAPAPVEPPCAPEGDAPPDAPPVEPDEPVTDELPRAPVPDDELPMAPDEPELDEPEGDDDEPEELEGDDEAEPPMLPLLPEPLEPLEPLEPMLPDALLEPVAGLALGDELPERLPDEPALADEPLLPLFRLLKLSLPRLDWSLPMPLPLPCLPASTPFPSFDF